jgi:hypothetical protein
VASLIAFEPATEDFSVDPFKALKLLRFTQGPVEFIRAQDTKPFKALVGIFHSRRIIFK